MKDTNFSIHNFMIDELGLDGVPLKVYALIYSFRRVGSEYHGSIEYICQRVGASYSSVYRAIKSLVAKNYIIKLTNKNDSPNTYEANMDILFQNDRPRDSRNDIPPLSNVQPPSVKTTDNNKDNNKDNNNLLTNHSFTQEKPRPIQAFGSKRLVMMTLHEYTNLLRAAGVLPTLRYVRLLENRIKANRLPVKDNHYEMIIGWAREDGLVTPEGEIILKN